MMDRSLRRTGSLRQGSMSVALVVAGEAFMSALMSSRGRRFKPLESH
jgi:hypothetical protein